MPKVKGVPMSPEHLQATYRILHILHKSSRTTLVMHSFKTEPGKNQGSYPGNYGIRPGTIRS